MDEKYSSISITNLSPFRPICHLLRNFYADIAVLCCLCYLPQLRLVYDVAAYGFSA